MPTITTIRLNYHCVLALPVMMKVTEVASLFELLSRCNQVESLYAADAKENVEYAEAVEISIKRVGAEFMGKTQAEVKVRDLNVAARAAKAAQAAQAAQV